MWWIAAAALLACAAALLFTVWSRAAHIRGLVGTFDCALRTGSADQFSDGWASYAGTELRWYPALGLRRRPLLTWDRDHVEIERAEVVDGRVGGPHRRVVLDEDGVSTELFMPDGAYAGLRAWLESSPPSWRNVRPDA